jgi:hypothetical protein
MPESLTDEELLDQLAGSWLVTGDVRGKPVSQTIAARRALAGKFVELRVTDGTPLIDGRPYEAAYFIGVAADGRFVMNLVDVFGAAYSAVPGIGHRDGDGLVFEFAYSGGPWTWRWTLRDGSWELRQTYVEDGVEQLFATKRMERR